MASAGKPSRWIENVESRAYARLQTLASRNLWDGRPPIPIEHVIEHLLELHIVWEEVKEAPGGLVLACLRPATREVVLNERHRDRFEATPGLERFSLGHEGGHADMFALTASPLSFAFESGSSYTPVRLSATNGEVVALPSKASDGLAQRSAAMWAAAEDERARWAAGEDSPRVRRAVNHYAAVLLMPQDLLRPACRGQDVQAWPVIYRIADLFQVSIAALLVRLQELGLIFGVDNARRLILLTDPGGADQTDLFGN
jgi:hypothetical protein